MELRDWTTHARIPAAYDHLVFRVAASARRTRALLTDLSRHGSVLEYGRRGGHACWSYLPEGDGAWLGAYKSLAVAVPAKIRMWFNDAKQELAVVPMWCPISPGTTSTPFDDVLCSAVANPETLARDRLDAVSLGGRAQMLRVLVNLLPELNEARLERRHLDRTFTRAVSERLEERVRLQLRDAAPVTDSRAKAAGASALPYWMLADEILEAVRGEYEKQDAPRCQRTSRGYTIQELIEKYRQPKIVHAAVDYLIDYGYLASYHGATSHSAFTRAVRATETYGPLEVQKLVATYALLAADQRIAATEAQKLLSIFRNCFGMHMDGIAFDAGLGGEVTRVKIGDEDSEDIVSVLERSKILTKTGGRNTRAYAFDTTHDEDELISDPAVERDYGRLRAVVAIVHNAEASLTPPQRATLLSTMAHQRRGLELVAHDAGAMASAYGAALAKQRTGSLFDEADVHVYREQMGRAHAEGKGKLMLFRSAAQFSSELPETRDPYERRLVQASIPPQRWEALLRLWDWYLDAFYATASLIFHLPDERERERELQRYIEQRWTVGPPHDAPYADAVRANAQIWRDALSGRGIAHSPDKLPTSIAPGAHWYAHYDLANSSKQVRDRASWFAGSAAVIHDWARLFSCGGSSTRETQAESGYVWSKRFDAALHASAWGAYMLYVLSELEQPEAEWTPIYGICLDEGPDKGVGQFMARAAKTTKGISRADAEEIAQHIRDYDGTSLDNRVFLLGEQALTEVEKLYPGLAQSRDEYRRQLRIDEPISMVPVNQLIDQFLTKLPRIE